MDMGIVNAGNLQVYDSIPVEVVKLIEEIIFDKSDDGKHVERIIAYAEKKKNSKDKSSSAKEKIAEEWRSFPVKERLKHSLIKVNY
jgi:5-methyltetrahydrofolate--homocysteine methyltransferase